jgi:hypothetical protein
MTVTTINKRLGELEAAISRRRNGATAHPLRRMTDDQRRDRVFSILERCEKMPELFTASAQLAALEQINEILENAQQRREAN